MNRIIPVILLFCLIFPFTAAAQQVTYSEYDREDNRDINFEIIGKMNGSFLVYKNIRWKHRLCIYDQDMRTKENIDLDFLPEKTLNVDFVTYPDFFYMIYQYQKRSIVHCMGVKMDGKGNKLAEPVELDTTQISLFSDNKIYTTINSEDKQQIMVFKIQKKNEKFNIVSLLFDKQLGLLKKTRQNLPFNDRRDNYSNFSLDNNGNLVFTLDTQPVNRDYSNALSLVVKPPLEDTFAYHTIPLNKKYIDDVRLKIDNLNKQYLINSFYYSKNRGSVEGLFVNKYDKLNQQSSAPAFIEFNDSLRAEARRDGMLGFALDDFFIREVIVKKDGGFLLTAEDFSTQSRNINNSLNRWDYFTNPYSLSSNSYYYYNPSYGYYRPFSSFSNIQNTRYFYENILVLSIGKNGGTEWARIVRKDQVDDDNDNFLSYATVNSGDEIHFLFNADSKNQIISDQSINPGGTVKRNATLKSLERGYQFMTKLSKQVGARQLLIPCLYRGYICFAKVDF